MILIIEYFRHQNDDRHREYLKCLEENIKNDFISKIEIFIEDETPLEIFSNKININRFGKRPTYDDMFSFCSEKYNGEICIISNSDIIFDDTLKYVNNENIKNKFLALTRWDIKPNDDLTFFDRKDSQDCWIFKSPINMKEKEIGRAHV